MKILDWNALGAEARTEALARPRPEADAELARAVAAILAEVRTGGDRALAALGARFDGVELDRLEVTPAEFAAAGETLDPALRAAIAEARERIRAYHAAGMQPGFALETAPGLRCESLVRAIGRVGLYVPAGSAPLPSTALMLGVPAELAGCPEIVLATPPRRDGSADPAVLHAASLCGIRRVIKAGGAQAIGALAFGTESLPACAKLFGPGNRWVTEAKRQVAMLRGGPAIDMPAGPSEVMVLADASARADFVAADLLSQCEHGPDSQALLVTDAPGLAEAVAAAIDAQLPRLPRAAIARASLAHARLIRCGSLVEAFAIANAYAPEHLILQLAEARRWLGEVRNAGSVFLGAWTPESLGDYCSGTNHVLPTDGHARARGGLAVADFQKRIAVQEASRVGLAAIGRCAMTLARAEGLEGHARAVELRLAAGEAA